MSRFSSGGSGPSAQGNLDPITRLPQLPAINPRPAHGRRTIDEEDLMSESNYAESPHRYPVGQDARNSGAPPPKSMTESVYSDDSKPSSESPRSSDYSPSYSRRVFRKSGYTSSETSSQQGTTPRLSTLYSPRNSTMTTPRSARGTPRRDKVVKGRLDPSTYSPMIGAREGKEGFLMSEGSGIPFNPYLDPFMQMKMMAEKQDKEKEVYASSGDEVKEANTNRPFNRRYSPIGILIFLFYLGSCLFYFVTRATKTLDMGFTWYGWIVLAVEMITSTATMGYAVLLIRYTRSKRTKGLPLAKPGHEPDEDNLKFHVRVLVPCYKETVDLVEITVKAALTAPLPADTRRTVYLCDDGNDPKKAEMISRLGKDCVYVTGRKRDPNGEVNGKSNNLNNCLRLIYSEYEPKDIPTSEVIVVFDADMVAKPNFFTKILEVMFDDNVALCLTPQAFNNVGPAGDIFNNLNLSFWEYMLPGLDALGYIACTGTNFCIRASPLADCGWFPTYTITEDYALGIELKKKNYKAVYLNEYLAVGEAPEEIRNIFRQRSRWCKGQMQVLFSEHCPLLDGKLSMGMRLLYTSVTWCYISNTIAVPLSVFVPFIALVFGIYPLVLNKDFALASLLYFTSQTLVTQFCIDVRHLKPLWYCQVSCHLLWFTFTKALFNILLTKARIKGKVVFKSTKKKGEEDEEVTSCCVPRLAGDLEGTKDYWVLVASFTISLITCVVGVFQIVDQPFTAQGDFRWYLLLSVFWAIYNIVPPSLFLFYCIKRGRTFDEFCSFGFVMAFLVAFGGLACAWLVPADYNTGQVLGLSVQFFQAQQSGKLPKNFPVPWRQSANLWDSMILPNGKNYSLVGGWYDQGDGLKVSYSIATTVAMLSWSFADMREGYTSSNQDDAMAASIRWGAEYLMKCHITNITGVSDMFIGQVGDLKLDHAFWGRPENMNMQRPAYAVDAKRPASDLMGSAAAGLAAASVALSRDSAQSAVLYLQRAQLLYKLATSTKGLYNKYIPTSATYPSNTMYDDLAWAAAWLYRATGDETYLIEAENHWQTSVQTELHVNPNPYMWNYENVLPGVHLLLEDFTGNDLYSQYADDFATSWMKKVDLGTDGSIFYTPKGIAKADPEGTLQHTANAAFFVMLYASRRSSNRFMSYNCWARTQIGYMLGDGGRSFVVGYGDLSPKKVPHRGASCPDPTQGECTWETAYYSTDTNPNILYGALVGGPDDQDVWFDDRDVNSIANSVGLLNNAGFTAALAGLHGRGINMAKCEQGNGIIQKLILKAKGMQNMPGQRWWEGI